MNSEKIVRQKKTANQEAVHQAAVSQETVHQEKAMSGNFSYAVTYQKRKTLVVYVHEDGNVEVRAPHGLSQKHIVRFVEEKSAWIERSLTKQSHKHQWKNIIEPGASLWFLGQPRRLEVERSSDTSIVYDEDVIVVAARDPWNLPALSRQLNTWYREQAQTVFHERLLLVCQRFPGIPAAPELRLRKMERRWGSCSRSGRITLNTELVKLPLSMIDYIIAHELCHLTEFNHSKKFYALLEFIMPDWKQRERILKQF